MHKLVLRKEEYCKLNAPRFSGQTWLVSRLPCGSQNQIEASLFPSSVPLPLEIQPPGTVSIIEFRRDLVFESVGVKFDHYFMFLLQKNVA